MENELNVDCLGEEPDRIRAACISKPQMVLCCSSDRSTPERCYHDTTAVPSVVPRCWVEASLALPGKPCVVVVFWVCYIAWPSEFLTQTGRQLCWVCWVICWEPLAFVMSTAVVQLTEAGENGFYARVEVRLGGAKIV